MFDNDNFEVPPGENSGELPDSAVRLKISKDNSGLGILTAGEYRKRRSDTLLNNPEATLDEEQEIKQYFDSQNPTYVAGINNLAQLDHPMKPSCRMVITIPAYNEGSRIKHTLEQYVGQNIDPSLFEIVVFANPAENDNTPEEVARFKDENPQVSVVFVNKTWDEGEPATVGNARKYASDIAMTRVLNRGSNKGNTIIVCNDADAVFIEKNYLSSVLAEFDGNPFRDALVTNMELPPEAMAKPNVATGYSLLDTFERTSAAGDLGGGQDNIPEPALINGRSSAMRMSIYAAVGGYNPAAVISEDFELGWILADARDWNPDRIIQFDATRLVTDPRRFMDSVINRVPVDQMLFDFQTRPDLRRLNNEAVLALIPDTFDWELFQDEADSVWTSQYSGQNKRIGKEKFALIFKSTMDKLGVEYEITKTDGIALTNVDRLIQRLAGSGREINIVHSQPRTYTPEMVRIIQNYFSEIPKGVIEARSLRADKIADKIKLAQGEGKVESLNVLLKEYERFAGHKYK